MFKRILYPVDFSKRSESIAPAVRAYAEAYGAEVYLVHVLQLPELMAAVPEYPAYTPDDMPAIYRYNAKRRLHNYLAEPLAGVRLHHALLEGEAAAEIARFAADNQIELVMIPTHGVGGFRRFLIGSTTAKILHDVRCPVWTSVHEDTDAPAATPPRNVICGVELSATSDTVLSYADVFTRRTGANVTMVHAVPKIESRPANFFDVDFDAHVVQEAKMKAEAFQQRLGTSFEWAILPGDAADVMRDLAVAKGADLIMVGRAHLMEGIGKIQSHTYDVINRSPCPVLNV